MERWDLNITPLAIPGALTFQPPRNTDARGWLTEIYSDAVAEAAGLDYRPVQENQSFSRRALTVRGIHFQRGRRAQGKLVRVAAGALISIIVDLRRGSPGFERAATVRQDAGQGLCLLVPRGCAHGVVTLEDNTALCWSCDRPFHAPSCDGLYWADPALGVDWPFDADAAIVSAKDRQLPRLAAQPYRFDDLP